jgi:hypothetical protein
MQTKKIYLATYWDTRPMSGSGGSPQRVRAFETYAQAVNFTKNANEIQEIDFEYESGTNTQPLTPSFGGVFDNRILPFTTG